MHSFRNDNGFSILEVLVAIFVSTLIIMVSNQLLVQSTFIGKKIAIYNANTSSLLYSNMLLTRDLAEAHIDKQHQLELEINDAECIRKMQFFTTNRQNTMNQLRSSLVQVTWYVQDGKLLRYYGSHNLNNISPTDQIVKGVKCLKLKRYNGRYLKMMIGITNQPPPGIVFNLSFINNTVIEKVIPMSNLG